MAKKTNPLIDLEEFLNENPSGNEVSKPLTKSQFIHSKPSTLVKEKAKKPKQPIQKETSLVEQIFVLAEKNKTSFAEEWLMLLKEARKQGTTLLPEGKKQTKKWMRKVVKQINKLSS